MRVFLGLGSNLGDRAYYLAEAISAFAPYTNGTNELVIHMFKVEEQVAPVGVSGRGSAIPTDTEVEREMVKDAGPGNPEAIIHGEKRNLFWVTFHQTYASESHRSQGDKSLLLRLNTDQSISILTEE